MEEYVDKPRVSIRPIYKPLARDMIEKNHYSGKLSSCRYPLGIFYQTDNDHKFFAEAEEKLKENAKDIKVLISYADPEQSHDGAIYQATNWIYQGCGAFQMAPTFSLRLEEDGEWMHSRSVYSKFGSAAPQKMKKAIGHTFWLKKEASKHRYIYFLGNKKENRKFHSVMKHPEMEYPKNYKHDIEITKVEVNNEKWKD